MTVVFHNIVNNKPIGTVEKSFGDELDALAQVVTNAEYHFVIEAHRNFINVGARKNPLDQESQHFCAIASGRRNEAVTLMRNVIMQAASAVAVQQPTPDFSGVWRAWNKTVTNEPGTMRRWLLHCPGTHPFITWWSAELIALEQLAQHRSVRLDYPDARYELHVVALEEQEQPIRVATWRTEESTILLPADICVQFHGISDAQAIDLAEQLVKQVTTGKLSPEQSNQQLWNSLVWGGIEHVTTGHPVGNA